nr:fyve-type zinc finger-containing protein c9b6.03 [Quercus suber]
MATMNFPPPRLNTSDYYMKPPSGPSPPDTASMYCSSTNKNLSQTPPSNNISPTTMQSSHMVRQLRQPRNPMYIPAALRPTEPASRPTDIPGRPRAPDTPPASKDSSFDGGKPASLQSSQSDTAVTYPGHDDLSDMAVLRRGLSRAASESLDLELEDVTGRPTDAHWKPDSSAADCAICHISFSLFFRRHHCRKCGDIVCDAHSRHRVPLDQNARYHPKGSVERACDPCWSEWRVVKKLRHSRAGSMADSASSEGTAIPGLPIPGQPRRPQEDARVGSMARSEGMIWSTF